MNRTELKFNAASPALCKVRDSAGAYIEEATTSAWWAWDKQQQAITQLEAKNRELAYQLLNQDGAIDAAVYGGKPSDTGFIRAFWRRIFVYRNDFEKELPKELPVEFTAAFETAAILLRKPSDREPEIGGPR